MVLQSPVSGVVVEEMAGSTLAWVDRATQKKVQRDARLTVGPDFIVEVPEL